MRLGTEHYTAINYLALPKRGGLTMQQIADEVGTSRTSLYNWLDDPVFSAELKKRMIRNSRVKLPDVIDSMAGHVVKGGNAAMAKLLLQMNDMLTDPVNVGDKLDEAGDMDAVQRRIEDYKNKQKDTV